MENPLVDFSGLPRFAAIRAEHVGPAIDSLVAEGRAAIERLAAAGEEPTWEGFVEPLESANERLARAWAQVTPPERGRQFAGAARGLQRGAAEGDAVRHRAGPGSAPVWPVQGARRLPGVRDARSREAPPGRQRAARLPPRGRGASGGRQGPLQAAPGGARRALGALPGQRPRRDQRLRPRRHRRRVALGPPAGRARGGPGGGGRRTGARAGSSRCTCRATCRSCSTRIIARCASRCTAPT